MRQRGQNLCGVTKGETFGAKEGKTPLAHTLETAVAGKLWHYSLLKGVQIFPC